MSEQPPVYDEEPVGAIDELTGEPVVGGIKIWRGGVPENAWDEQERIAQRLGDAQWARVLAHPLCVLWLAIGLSWRVRLQADCVALTEPYDGLNLSPAITDGGYDERARMFLYLALNHTFNMMGIAVGPQGLGDLKAPAQVQAVITPYLDEWRRGACQVLAAIGEPVTRWNARLILGYLFGWGPRVVPYPCWLDEETPYAPGAYQAGTALGSPDTTERIAVRTKREVRAHYGLGTQSAKPGPKSGSKHARREKDDDLERYLLSRSKAGVSAEMLTLDAEAQRRYRAARGWDSELTAAVVRSRLRKLRGRS